MGNDEKWIRSLRAAGREYETAQVAGLWKELEGELIATGVARREVWAYKLWWYVAASLMVAAVVSTYIICGRHNPDGVAPVLTIFASGNYAGNPEVPLFEEEVGPSLVQNVRVGNETALLPTSASEGTAANQPEIEGYGEFSYYERIIVVENGPDPMDNDCVLVSAGKDMKALGNSHALKANHGKGIDGRLYASTSVAKLSGGVPVSAGATVSIPIADRLRLETGLEYSGVKADGAVDGYIGVPVKVSYDIYERDRMRVYASAGGAVDKSLGKRDVSMSLNAGVGLEYTFDDDWGVFIEPGVEYRPGDGGSMSAVYGDRHVGPEVRAGFRYTFR